MCDSMSFVERSPARTVRYLACSLLRLRDPSSGKRERTKAPKIQRLITPVTLQRKRHRIALRRKRLQKRREDAAAYHKLVTQIHKVRYLSWRQFNETLNFALRQEKAAERAARRRSSRSSKSEAGRSSTSSK